MYIVAHDNPLIMRTQLNVDAMSKTVVSKFMPKIPVMTAKMVVTKVAAVKSNSNFMSWF